MKNNIPFNQAFNYFFPQLKKGARIFLAIDVSYADVLLARLNPERQHYFLSQQSDLSE